MKRVVLVMFALHVVAASVPAFALWNAEKHVCGPNGDDRVLWLFIEAPGTCSSTVPECFGATSSVIADCSQGCESVEGEAGCWATINDLWDPSAVPVLPLLSVECETGTKKTYDLTPSTGGSCQRIVDGGNTTGGECKDTNGNVNAKLDCEKGCESESGGATCKVR